MWGQFLQARRPNQQGQISEESQLVVQNTATLDKTQSATVKIIGIPFNQHITQHTMTSNHIEQQCKCSIFYVYIKQLKIFINIISNKTAV